MENVHFKTNHIVNAIAVEEDERTLLDTWDDITVRAQSQKINESKKYIFSSQFTLGTILNVLLQSYHKAGTFIQIIY